MLFSIITVTFNAAPLLRRTFDSITSQSYTDYEVLLVDGASKDKTLTIAAEYSLPIHTLSEPDNGIYDAMNKGIRMAQGDYLIFLNAGDTFFDSQVLANVATQIRQQETPPEVVYGETALVDNNGTLLGMRRLHAPEQLTAESFLHGMLVCHQSFYVRRTLAPPYDPTFRYSADYDWCIRILRSANTIVNTHCTLTRFLQGGTTTQQRRASLLERYHIMTRHYGWTRPTLLHLWFACRFGWAKLTGKPL